MPDPSGGYYFQSDSKACEVCSQWSREKKSCASKNAKAAGHTCHKFGANAMDKVCFDKVVTPGK